MKKLLIAVGFAFAFASAAHAGVNSRAVVDAGWEKLTDSQRAQILSQVAEQAKASPGTVADVAATVTDPKKLDQYASLGTKIADAIAAAAKGIGVAVNDFVKTPVGMLTVGLIVWHFVGTVIVHLFAATVVLVVGLIVFRVLYKRMTTTEIKYSADKTDLFGRARKLEEVRHEFTTDELTYLSLYIIVLVIVTSITAFAGW